jgi:hypothetical protein
MALRSPSIASEVDLDLIDPGGVWDSLSDVPFYYEVEKYMPLFSMRAQDEPDSASESTILGDGPVPTEDQSQNQSDTATIEVSSHLPSLLIRVFFVFLLYLVDRWPAPFHGVPSIPIPSFHLDPH